MAIPHRLPLSHVGRDRRLLGHPPHATRCAPPSGLLGRGHPPRGAKLRRREAARRAPDARREGHRLQRDGPDLRVARHPRVGRPRTARLRQRPPARPVAGRYARGDPRAHAGRDPPLSRGALPAGQHGHGRRVPVVGRASDGAREGRRDARRARPGARHPTVHDRGRRPAGTRRRAGRASPRRVPVRHGRPAEPRPPRVAREEAPGRGRAHRDGGVPRGVRGRRGLDAVRRAGRR